MKSLWSSVSTVRSSVLKVLLCFVVSVASIPASYNIILKEVEKKCDAMFNSAKMLTDFGFRS